MINTSTIKITPEILSLIAEIDEFKGAWRALGTLAPERLSALHRVLTTLLLLHAGYTYVPFSSLESVIEQSKESYYLGLRQTQGTIRTESPNWNPWLLFFFKSMQQQMQRLRIKVEKEKLLMTQLPELSLEIMDYVRNHGRITMSEAVTITEANRNTLKDHFKGLLERNLLVLNGKGRGAWYSLQ